MSSELFLLILYSIKKGNNEGYSHLVQTKNIY